MIFFRSFWVSAHEAASMDVKAPSSKQAVVAVSLLYSIFEVRMSRNTPATTMVLECSRADTGVGPSIAAGSHGWNPN